MSGVLINLNRKTRKKAIFLNDKFSANLISKPKWLYRTIYCGKNFQTVSLYILHVAFFTFSLRCLIITTKLFFFFF